MSDDKRPNWLELYNIDHSIEVLKAKSPEWGGKKVVYDMSEIHTKDAEVLQAWRNIFNFRYQMQLGDGFAEGRQRPLSSKSKKYARILIATYNRYNCSQAQAAAYSGIPLKTVRRLSKKVPEVREAYEKARYQMQLRISREWHRRRAKARE